MIDVYGIGSINFASQENDAYTELFDMMGFTQVSPNVFEQNNIVFTVNETPGSSEFCKQHGPSVSGFSFLTSESYATVEGIGGSSLEFISETDWSNQSRTNNGLGLTRVDHLTHNVYPGNMDKWATFYESGFGFKEVHFFDITGEATGLTSKAMSNGTVAIPINEDKSDNGQIANYLKEYNGEGVQHIAMLADNIYETVELMRENGIQFLDVPDTYYEDVKVRIPNHGEDLDRLQKNKILIDGKEGSILLQIFTKTCIGPIFFELIQRKNNTGFGEGNFQALFEAIERDTLQNS
jgi:4-hydroxyphenylpyruvate dioxygenase